MSRYWPWLAAAASGGLLAVCYAPARWGGLAWIALIPLVAAVWFSQQSVRREGLRLFSLGYVAGLGYFVGSLHWLWTVTVPGWLLLGAYLAIYPAVWALFLGLVARPVAKPGSSEPVWFFSWSNLRAAALAACAWVALEWVRSHLFTGFGWNALGVALVDNLPIIQIADFTGVAGVSFLLVFVNVVAAITLIRLPLEVKRRKMRAHLDFSLAVVLVALAFGYGVRRIFAAPPDSVEVTFAAVQADVPIQEKRDPAQETAILQLHERLSETALAMSPDLLVWPEAATPQPLFLHQPSWDVVRRIAGRLRGDFLTGTVHYEEAGDYNSVALLTRTAAEAQFYHKMHLVPFGEYVPLRDSFPLFAWIVGDLVPEDFDFGPEPTILEMTAKPVKIGPLICFEDTLPDIARAMALRGAQVFITVTNDAWFLRTAAAVQHRDNALMRTIEARLPMVRVANTGVTCAIDSLGRETHRLQTETGSPFLQGVLFGSFRAPTRPSPTFFVRHGEVVAGASSLVTLLALLAFGVKEWRMRRKFRA
ncbi:MAG: apolipoprotein N-acyltransferase [Terrimicrobiaceae bacterium]